MGLTQSQNSQALDITYRILRSRVQEDLPRLKDLFKYLCQQTNFLYAKTFHRLLNEGLVSATADIELRDPKYILTLAIFKSAVAQDSSQMTFENFVSAYAMLMYPQGNESADLAFRLFSLYPQLYQDVQEEFIMGSKFVTVGVQVLKLTQDECELFMIEQNILPTDKVTRETFHVLFRNNQEHRLFSWLRELRKEFSGLENAEEMNQMGRASSYVQTSEFSKEEYEALVRFFDAQIASQTEIKQATKIFENIFSDRSIHLKLRNRLIESFLYASESKMYDKKVFMKILHLLFKERNEVKQVEFIFDIFTKFSKYEVMNNSQIRDVISAFSDMATSNSNFDQLEQVKELDKQQFVQYFTKYFSHAKQFNKMSYVLNIEFGVRPEYSTQEADIINDTLEWDTDLTQYAQKQMRKGDCFFLLNKKFYEEWLEYTGSKQKKSDVALKIDNEALFDSKKPNKLGTIKLNDNVVVVPARVWTAFTNWYGASKEIKRFVIQYPFDAQRAEDKYQNNVKIVDNQVVYELEIDMIYIRFGLLSEDGKPSKELNDMYISRKITLLDLQEKILKIYRITDLSKTRLWLKKNLLQGELLCQVIEDNREIKNGSKFFIEKQLENERWPSDEKMIKQKTKNSIYEIRTKGCFNLGNTCFINSVIQCVTNTPFFKQYFLQNVFYQSKIGQYHDYQTQINPSNPMGYKGEIVLAFAALINDLFTSSSACFKTPKRFKNAISKYHEQFRGFQQQDAQEFLVTMLDSLHEELNIRIFKPYIENPSSSGRDERELMYEYWSNFLHRNWSFILFIFYGQMKSSLKCLKCKTERLSFDVFSTLSLPLPDSSLITLKIIIYLIPQEVKYLIENRHDQVMEHSRRLDMARKQSLNFEIQEQTLQSLTKEKPILFSIQMNPQAAVGDIYQYLQRNFSNLELLDQSYSASELLYYLYSDKQQCITDMVGPQIKLNMIREGTTIHCVETLNMRGKQTVQQVYSEMQEQIHYKNNALLQFQESYKSRESGLELELEEVKDFEGIRERRPPVAKMNKFDYFQQHQIRQTEKGYRNCQQSHYDSMMIQRDSTLVQQTLIEAPDEYLIVLVNRKILQKELYYLNKFEVQLFGHPFLVQINKETTGRELYEEVWMKARFMLNLSQSQNYSKRSNLWWTQQDYDETKVQYSPFILKYVRTMYKHDQLCSKCQVESKCFGCVILPTHRLLHQELQEHSFLAIDWNLDFLQSYYQTTSFKPMEHKSIRENEMAFQKEVELLDCLRLFNGVEDISVKEGLKCATCCIPTDHVRQMSVSMLPPILIIHLKRFKIVNKYFLKYNVFSMKKKVTSFVHFPLYDLDISPFLSYPDASLKRESYTYDLYGVINHYGMINGGHYTSFVKNELTNNWLQYDDSSVKDVPESKIRSEYAYILFYKRRDLSTMNIKEVYPSIQKVFRGRPVRLQGYGSKLMGYVWDERPSHTCRYHVKIQNSNIDFYSSGEDLYLKEEKDDMSEIQQQFKRQQLNGSQMENSRPVEKNKDNRCIII